MTLSLTISLTDREIELVLSDCGQHVERGYSKYKTVTKYPTFEEWKATKYPTFEEWKATKTENGVEQ